MNLYQLTKKNYSLATSLYAADYPNITMVHAIIEGSLPGDIWVDDVAHPQTALVMTRGGFSFIAGEMDYQIFQACFEVLSKLPVTIRLVCEATSIDFAKYGFSTVERLQFGFDLNQFPQHVKKPDLELIHLKTKENLQACNTYGLTKLMSETDENFFKNGNGYAFKDKAGKIASEALAVIASKTAEPNVFTHPDYQRQGLAKFVCHKLITDLIKSARQPKWTCDKSNLASVKLALQLGMQQTGEYEFKLLTLHPGSGFLNLDKLL